MPRLPSIFVRFEKGSRKVHRLHPKDFRELRTENSLINQSRGRCKARIQARLLGSCAVGPLSGSTVAFVICSSPQVMGNVFGRKKAALDTLDALPDDTLQLVIAACGYDGLLRFEAVKGLACVSKALLQQLHRLQPLVAVQSLAVMQRPAHGPWSFVLLYTGKLTGAVLDEAKQGRVCAIDARQASLGPRIAKRVVPELLGTGCSLLELECRRAGPRYSSTWAAIFGEAAVCSAVLQMLDLRNCMLRGPLPELRLPALHELLLCDNQLSGGLEPLLGCTALKLISLNNNRLTGGLEPIRGCTALKILGLNDNMITGGLEPLRGCTAMQELCMADNLLAGGLEPLRGCTALKILCLSDNTLTGGLEPLRGCTALEGLYVQSLPGLHNLQLAGSLEPLRGCTALKVLGLSDNRIAGGLEPLGVARRCRLYIWRATN